MNKKRRTVFNTPVLNTLLRWLAILVLKLAGWKTTGNPPRRGKYVLIGVPHTSNWDFALMLPVILKYQLDIHWMGKHTLFPWPVGWIMKWLGGIPIDRRQANNMVEQMVEVFRNSENMVLLITPEGTRSKVDRWKAGFYHIARDAGVPIVLGYIDAPKQEAGFGPLFTPSGDYDADLPKIMDFYRDKTGLRPPAAPIRL